MASVLRPQPCSSLDYVVSPTEATMTTASGARKASSALAEPVVAAPAPHYLEQLQPAEIARASAAINAYAAAHNVGDLRFNTVMLQEPRKAEQLAFEHGRGPRPARQALVILLVPGRDLAVEALVELRQDGGDEVVAWKELAGVQPMTTPDDNFLAEDIVKACPETMALVKERYALPPGAILICDAWACHNMPEHLNAKRLMQCFLYVKLSKFDNEYAHPLDLVPVVDLNARKVVHVDMYDRPAKMPPLPANYHRDLARQEGVTPRDDVMPLNVTQPMGPSFSVDGSLVRWQRWQFRVGFNAREGLVLHQLAYNDGGRPRPVLHRASLVEMAVPYGDPHYPYVRKCAFDIGDYGMGFNCNSLTLGCDCLGHIKYFDGHVNDAKGQPVTIRRAVCMHEEDAGIAWKHWDSRTNHAEVRRSRRLVVSQVSTFQNYEYCAYWYLYQDGTISFELKLTGILSTSNSPGPENKFGVEVHDGVAATVHQHFVCMRIDPAVDDPWGGKNLVVSEVEAREVPHSAAAGNPYGNGFYMHETELAHTGQAGRDHNFHLARFWKIKNPYSINPTSRQPVAYKLMPAPSPKLMAAPGSLVAKRAVFATKALWVTPFADDQKYPAGDHVVQSRQCTGLAEWTKGDKPLLGGADPVLWYSFGVTHMPRVEDFPIMPVEVTGFMLRPAGFFATNPSLDLPWDKNAASKEHQAQAEGGGAAAQSCAACPPVSKM